MSLGRVLERMLLAGLEADERERVLEDLRELAWGRPSMSRRLWYWTELMKYPVRLAWDAGRERFGPDRRERRGTPGHTRRRGGMETLGKDVRYAVRSLVRDPGFTVTAVLILAVGMGATASIIAVVHGVLLEPLPVSEPDRLVSVWIEHSERGRGRMTPGNFRDIEALDGAFESVAAFSGQTASLAREGGPVFLRGSRVTPAYLETLGIRPLLGRGFRPDEGEIGGPPVVVLGHHVWQQLFGGDPGIVRQTIELDGTAWDVIGIAPPGVYPTEATVSAEIPFTSANQDFFVPLRYGEAGWANRRSHVLGMIARIGPGTEPELARERLAALAASLRSNEPLNEGDDFLMTSFTEEVVGDVRFALLTLLGSVGLVLLIAVVNVASLFALRADDRAPHAAVRSALGASRGRLLRQSMLESALVGGAACALAVVVARATLGTMRALVPYQIPRLATVELDGVALVATLVAGVAVALLLGLLPIARSSAAALGSVGRERHTVGIGRRRLQSGVVTVQATLCVVVLVGAALLTRSYAELRAVDPGFGAPETWAMSIPAPADVLEEIRRRVEELPGVSSAAVAYDHPLERNWGDSFLIEGVERSDTEPAPSASLRPFGTGYFETVGIDVTEGRLPTAADEERTVGLAVVNESLVRDFLGGRSAVGSRIVVPTARRAWGLDGVFEVGAVVRDVRFLGPDQPPGPALYVPLSHFPAAAATLLVRPERPDLAIVGSVRAVVAEVDPRLGVQTARRLEDILDDLVARPRFNMMLLLSFGGIALVLCGLGAYGLVARLVATRVPEIGIRMALGADGARVARGVLGQAMRPVLLGCVSGMVMAGLLARTVRSLLFGISPADPASFVSSAAVVVLAGLVAAMLPTVRATSVDPARALRSE